MEKIMEILGMIFVLLFFAVILLPITLMSIKMNPYMNLAPESEYIESTFHEQTGIPYEEYQNKTQYHTLYETMNIVGGKIDISNKTVSNGDTIYYILDADAFGNDSVLVEAADILKYTNKDSTITISGLQKDGLNKGYKNAYVVVNNRVRISDPLGIGTVLNVIDLKPENK